MLIQDVEKRTGLDRATVRFYEKEGLVVPRREENRYRTYTEEDIQLFLKIKLLRQLGLPLEKIKNLQQGSGDFLQTITEQIERLEQKLIDDNCARLVCCEMKKDGAQYNSLNSTRYLKMLEESQQPQEVTFREPIEEECHPWRRYFARCIDYQIIGVIFKLLYVIIVETCDFSGNSIHLDYLDVFKKFAAVPILAAMLHYLGTTPGKWIMGIRLESIHGGRLSGGEALYREGKLLWHGAGLFLPIINIWKEYKSYQNEKNGTMQIWDEDTEIVYIQRNGFAKTLPVLILVITFCATVFLESRIR